MSRSTKPDEGLYVLKFVGLIIAWLVLAHFLKLAIAVPFAKSLLIAAFVLVFAHDVGYHRRDALWAALPSPVAPYFILVIAWRVVNLPGNRYWETTTEAAEEESLV